MENLKLYVWENYGCDYTCGIAFALAENSEEARKMIIENSDCADKETLANEPSVYEDVKVSFDIWGGG